MLAILERRRLFAVVLTLALLAGCVLLALPRDAMAADPLSTVAASKINVRAALAGAASADIALVDQVTPRPSIEGKSILCVDGDFYAKAGNDVVNDVKEKARGGTPVVFIGGDINGLSLSLGGVCEAAANAETEPQVEFAALKLTPGADGQPVFNGFVAPRGSQNIRSTMTGVREWLKKVDEPKAVEADGNWYQRGYFRLYSEDTLSPHGKMCIDRYYYRVSNDQNPTLDFISVEIRYEQMSGQSAYGANWKNEYAYQYCNVKTYQGANNSLLRYGPTGYVGSVTTSFTLGVTASENPGVTATYGRAYTQPDVACVNYSDLGGGYTKHKWNISRDSDVATSTFVAESNGFTYSHVQSGGLASHYERFESRWKQYHWYGDDWYKAWWDRQVSNI